MDPFASIIKFCIPTAEMEAQFANCPYARESEIFSDSSSETIGNVVTSPLGSSSSVDQQPERQYNSHLSSSADQNPQQSSATHSPAEKVRVSLEPKTIEVVMLDEESDSDAVPLGETEVIVIDDDGEENVKNISKVDLKIGGSKKKPKRVRQRGDISGKKRDLPPACLKGKGKKAPSLNGKEKRKEKEVVVESSPSSNEKEKRKGKEVVGESSRSSKGKDKDKEFVGERSSRSSKGKDKEKEFVGESWEKKDTPSVLYEFLDILKDVIRNGGCDNNDGDYMSTAKEKGIEIPKPRWWLEPDGDTNDAEYWLAGR